MSEGPETIISDAEITRVHAYANFGSMTPREVVNDGVRKYAVGYTSGSTQVAILREHGLITTPKGCGYKANLTEEGKRYARSIYRSADLPLTTAQIMADERVRALVEALVKSADGWANTIEMGLLPHQHFTSAGILRDEALAALAAIKEPKP